MEQESNVERCAKCGAILDDSNTRPTSKKVNIAEHSPYCLECEQAYYDKLAKIEGRALALFHSCMAFDVPCEPMSLPEDYQETPDVWKSYINNLISTEKFEKDEQIRTFFDGITDLFRIFGKNLTEADFSKYIRYERERLTKLPGTQEQRDKWGIQWSKADVYTTEVYDELDKQYESRIASYAGQTITPQMRDTITKVVKWNREIDRLLAKGNFKAAKDLQSMVDKILESESLREKDKKPIGTFRPDAWIDAFERNGLMKQGDFKTLEEVQQALCGLLKRKKYDYSLDVADQILLNWENNFRANADMPQVYALPKEMELVDDHGEFEAEETEEEKKRKRYAKLTKVKFVDNEETAERLISKLIDTEESDDTDDVFFSDDEETVVPNDKDEE